MASVGTEKDPPPSSLRRRRKHNPLDNPVEEEMRVTAHKDQTWCRLFRYYRLVFAGLAVLLVAQFSVGFFFMDDPWTPLFLEMFAGSNVSRLSARGLNLSCSVVALDAQKAMRRARSLDCQQKLYDVACLNEEGKLYPDHLENLCPVQMDSLVSGHYLGCFEDSFNSRILPGSVTKLKGDNCPEKCLKLCAQSGFRYSGVQYSFECFCGQERPEPSVKISESNCDSLCPGNQNQKCGGYLAMNVYQTGVIPFKPDPPSREKRTDGRKARIVFLLTINGRAVRQVVRLVKKLYHKDDFILIHVDSRQDYMFRELLPLERFENIRLVRERFATIWGGASLLQMLQHCIRELLDMDWKWDFVMNLSESDFPVKPVNRLREYLTQNLGRNFVKSHGRETSVFIRKQGLDRTFYECENHMWRLGYRKLPAGIQMDGGSDWICLSRDFASYVVNGDDQLISGLRTVFAYTLLPAEAFFHVALRNSHFCSTMVNNNLRMTNWKRKQGCKCQHKAVVDWCGCSPNDFLPLDWPKINGSYEKQIYFARKFEPIVNQEVINRVDRWISVHDYDFQLPGLHDYWQNIYHHLDVSPQPKPEMMTLATSIIRNVLTSDQTFDGFKLTKLLALTSYQHRDELRGVILHFSLDHSERNNHMEIETLAEVNSPYYHTKIKNRKVTIGIGTDYDPKEVLFRNIFQSMDPHSEPTLLYKVASGHGGNFDLDFTIFDPTGSIFFVVQRSFNESSFEDSIKPNISHPLLPGIYFILVHSEKSIVGRLTFLVTPPVIEDKCQIRDLGWQTDSTVDLPRDNETFLKTSFLAAFKIQPDGLKKASSENLQKSGNDLETWISELASKFYRVSSSCIITGNVNSLQTCSKTSWSTFASDPKSKIHGIHDEKGIMH